jgi:hypothetical protein
MADLSWVWPVGLGILLIWLSTKSYAWVWYLLDTSRRHNAFNFHVSATPAEEGWMQVKLRIIFFLGGLGLILWKLGDAFGFWDRVVPR